jgi:hypothetical protein
MGEKQTPAAGRKTGKKLDTRVTITADFCTHYGLERGYFVDPGS